jgi:serine/threonine-protein kinase
VRVLECGGDFLVMELVEKPRTLADALGQPFAPERACLIAFQILAALEAAPLVHGDLRPPNVFLDDTEGVRVTGFGLHYVLTVLSATRGGNPTPPANIVMYAPPERLHGTEDLGHPADVYGVGAMLYEMLAGAPPFDAQQSVWQLNVDAQITLPPPLADAKLDAIVQCAMRKDPWARFPSAKEMAEALRTGFVPSLNPFG